MKISPVRKTVLTAIITAAALISFLIESLFPPLFIPGARLGISNIFVLFALIYLGGAEGFAVLTVKILLGSLFTGNLSAMMFSLPSGLIALAVQYFLLARSKKLSVVAISALGGALNLAAQNVIFCLIAGGSEYLIYLPYLSAIGALSGAFVGITVYLLIKRVPRKFIGTENLQKNIKENDN